MRQNSPRNLAASVKARLLQIARDQREELQSVLTRYAVERFLYRLSASPYQEQFVLKGAILFAVWTGNAHRPTRDLDLLGFGNDAIEPMVAVVQTICRQLVEEDGLVFESESVVGSPIRENAKYAGLRLTLRGSLGNATIPMQIDIGFGDVVTPKAQEAELQTLLNGPPPRLQVYPRETVVAEKCEALVDLGLSNSRFKDFYDLWYLATHFDFDGPLLHQAIAATFKRRGTNISALPPIALTSAFYEDNARQRQWQIFWSRSNLSQSEVASLEECVHRLSLFLLPRLKALQDQANFSEVWQHDSLLWHPTLSEAVMEAAQDVKGESVHK